MSNQLHPQFQVGVQQFQQGQLAAAEASLSTVLGDEPENADAWHLAGLVSAHLKKFEEAVQRIRRAIELNPNFATFHGNLGNVYFERQSFTEAIACYEKALQFNPQDVEILRNLGICFKQQGEFDRALNCYDRAIAINPQNAAIHICVGNVLRAKEDPSAAIESYQRALAIDAKSVAAYINMGSGLADLGRRQEALECFQHAVQLDPRSEEAWLGMGGLLKKSAQFGQAINCFERLLAINPQNSDAHFRLGNTLKDQGRVAEAIEAYQKALAADPNSIEAHSRMLLLLNCISEDPQDTLEQHRNWAQCHAASIVPVEHARPSDQEQQRRLKIGYVSGDFQTHSVAYFLLPILSGHDRESFEVFAYVNNRQQDETTQQLREVIDQWREVHDCEDNEFADMIRRDQIDILIDLSGHTDGGRPLVFARKPAPVQVTYLGYANTTGLDAIDYRITDSLADPEGVADPYHTERLIRLPQSFLCYQPPRDCPDINLSQRAEGITFGSFNHSCKIGQNLIRCWAEILSKVPNSRLLLKSQALLESSGTRSVWDAFSEFEIAKDRIELLGWVSDKSEHLSTYDRVDISLDTYPYNGTTTTCESMWMGVPLITWSGPTHASRVGASLLTSVGLSDLITDSAQHYVRRAIDLAGDQKRLHELRSTLRDRMLASPLTNAGQLTLSLENAYRQMWTAFCEGKQSPLNLGASSPTTQSTNAIKMTNYDDPPNEDALTAQLPGGVRVCAPNSLQKMTSYVLLEQQDWFEAEMNFVRALMTDGMNVLDIGANHGVYALTMAKLLNGTGSVTAYEPAEGVRQFLQRSIHANGFENLQLVGAALSDRQGESHFFEAESSELSTLNPTEGNPANQTIELRTLDSEMDRLRWPSIDFVKMDAEGEESKILDGGAQFFANYDPLIMFELKHGSEVNLPLIDRFQQLGYAVYRLVPELNLLIGFDANQPFDGFLLNLFACSTNRAAELEKKDS